MKRFFKVFLAFTLLLTLVACTNDNSNFEVDEKDKVDLTHDELLDELDGVVIEEVFYKVITNTSLETKESNMTSNQTMYLSTDLIVQEFKTVGDGEVKQNSEGIYYITNMGFYINGKFKMEGQGVDLDLDGKYKVDESLSGLFGEAFDLNGIMEFDFDEILNNPIFKELVEEYSGLTFYKNENKLQIKFVLNNKLLEDNLELLEEALDMTGLEDSQEIDFEALLTIENKKVSFLGFKVTIKDDEVSATTETIITTVDEMPQLPNDLDEYEEYDLFDIFS